jgi:hypothetical protein
LPKDRDRTPVRAETSPYEFVSEDPEKVIVRHLDELDVLDLRDTTLQFTDCGERLRVRSD